MEKCIRIAEGYFPLLGGLPATIFARAPSATGTQGGASSRLNGIVAIETNGVLTDMLSFGPGNLSLEATTAIHE
jgi:hypothetical protein